ncbi:hypothetical protein QJQ45_008141 [Haematococcus lacustris]|nr:hypothetical protein QJQ45_008141 [Haematococcus lacustris]
MPRAAYEANYHEAPQCHDELQRLKRRVRVLTRAEPCAARDKPAPQAVQRAKPSAAPQQKRLPPVPPAAYKQCAGPGQQQELDVKLGVLGIKLFPAVRSSAPACRGWLAPKAPPGPPPHVLPVPPNLPVIKLAATMTSPSTVVQTPDRFPCARRHTWDRHSTPSFSAASPWGSLRNMFADIAPRFAVARPEGDVTTPKSLASVSRYEDSPVFRSLSSFFRPRYEREQAVQREDSRSLLGASHVTKARRRLYA